MDRLACDVAGRAKLFENLEAKNQNHVDKATTLLKLTMGGFFTEGALSARAREIILGCLATPGFLTGYFAGQQGVDTDSGDGGADGRSRQGRHHRRNRAQIHRGLNSHGPLVSERRKVNQNRLSWPTGAWAIQVKRTLLRHGSLHHLDGPHTRAMTNY